MIGDKNKALKRHHMSQIRRVITIEGYAEFPKGFDKEHRLEQIREFALFPDHCGGCKAKRYGQEG